MKHRINQSGPLDFGNVVERHRQEGRVDAYGKIIETLKALQLDNHDMSHSDLIDAVQALKDREVS